MNDTTPLPAPIENAIEIMANHLALQRKRSVAEGDCFCAYRGDDDCKCIIWALLPDSLYGDDVEDHPIDELMGINSGINTYLRHWFQPEGEEHLFVKWLNFCQRYHDSDAGDIRWNEGPLCTLHTVPTYTARLKENLDSVQLNASIRLDLITLYRMVRRRFFHVSG